MNVGFHPQPKPEPRKRVKGRKQRAETAVKQQVRAACVVRDGQCRLRRCMDWHVCGGESEWAHLGEKKRARTRGMDPARRHTTQHSAMLCTTAHRAYDAGEFGIIPLTTDGADGLLAFSVDGKVYRETR